MSVRVRELTPAGPGAISVLRFEGAGALELVASWGLARPRVGEPRLARLSVAGEALDEALVLPFSTEEVEVHLHGSPPLVAAFLERAAPAEAAAPDSIEECAQRALANAPCRAAARVLLDQAEGALRRELELALDEEAGPRVRRLRALAQASAERARLFEPARVVLAGPVNAGKSTLFNLLLGEERAICSDEPGTTRDLLVERGELAGWPVTLIDGAGQRALVACDSAGVERAGQELARRATGAADLVIWLRPPGGEPAPRGASGPRLVELGSRCDLPGGATDGVSALGDPEGTLQRVESLFLTELELPDRPWIPGRAVVFEAERRGELGAWLEQGGAPLAEGLRGWLEGGDVAGRRPFA